MLDALRLNALPAQAQPLQSRRHRHVQPQDRKTDGDPMSYEHALLKVLDAAQAGTPGGMSTGEALMAALALNRPDWLAERGYTIVEALERIGSEWQRMLPEISRAAQRELAARGEQHAQARQDAALASLAGPAQEAESPDPTPIHLGARLVTTGSAPGYRDASLVFDLEAPRRDAPIRAELRLRPEDGEWIVRHLREVHALAWASARGPLDIRAGETRPRWLDAQ